MLSLLTRRVSSFLPDILEKPEFHEFTSSYFIPWEPIQESKDEFPRRVQVGEVLYYNNSIPILSPINGIANLESKGNQLGIRLILDGSLEDKKPSYSLPSNKEQFYKTIESLGVISLDFPNLLLKNYFETISSHSNFEIVLSPYSSFPTPSFYQFIVKDYLNDFHSLVSILQNFFPNAIIHNYYNKNLKPAHYPYEGNPKYFLQMVCGFSVLGKNPMDLKKILYMGSETIFHLIRALFYGIPFTRRHLVLNIMNSNGSRDRRKKVYFLPNGYPLNFIVELFKDKKLSIIYGIEFNSPRLQINPERFFWNIYGNPQITIYLGIEKKHKELPCIECYECNLHCPTNAMPLGLIKSKWNFQLNYCIDCGVCNLICPSGIDFRKRIHALRNS